MGVAKASLCNLYFVAMHTELYRFNFHSILTLSDYGRT